VRTVSKVSILRVLTKQGGAIEKPEAYPLRYVEDFFGGSNAVAVKLSKFATASLVSPSGYGSPQHAKASGLAGW
jgi:hypothetical protein